MPPGVDPNIVIIYKKVIGRDVLTDKPTELLSQEYHIVEISDNGIGFEQVDADRIFTIFTRLHGKEHYKGSGIGLSIVRQVIENHNGFVWATSEAKRGFFIYVYIAFVLSQVLIFEVNLSVLNA